MTNRDLLKEAIADAKAIKETAIANTKAERIAKPFKSGIGITYQIVHYITPPIYSAKRCLGYTHWP